MDQKHSSPSPNNFQIQVFLGESNVFQKILPDRVRLFCNQRNQGEQVMLSWTFSRSKISIFELQKAKTSFDETIADALAPSLLDLAPKMSIENPETLYFLIDNIHIKTFRVI